MPPSKCQLCDGTKTVLTPVSFPEPSFGESRCYVCKGFGVTNYQASEEQIEKQARYRRLNRSHAREAA